MPAFITSLWHALRSFLIIAFCLLLGNGLSMILPIIIPGSILGMLLLFMLLATHLIPVIWIQLGCQIFMRYMILTFIPVAVSVMACYSELMSHFAPIIVSTLVSTAVVLVMVGYSTHYAHHTHPLKKAQKRQSAQENK